ncbi:MAG: Aspartate/methionine/tyrosine aminotransferase [Candidatus Alkanophagales archaeon MCA70_species_1]|nr:Aspartate/methionine/tyrosine aminotransferase [Candidatus Alkanophaga volatiphilum]
MRRFVAQRVRSVRSSGIRRFFDLAQSIEGIISLGVGEPDFVTPWNIREACIFALEKGVTSYTSNWGLLELRDAISWHLEENYGVSYDPESEILVTTGVSEGLDLAVRAVVDPGDEVLIHEPSYVSYVPCVVFAGGVPVTVETSEDDEFKLTAESLEAKITERTKALILNYPNNPTGAIMRKKDLEEIADVVNEHDLLVISDEIYALLTYEGKHTCFSSLDGMKERTILLNGFSKAYAMTGWRLGFAAGNAEIIEAMMKIHQYTMLCAPVTAQVAALEALNAGEKYVREMVEEYDRRRRLILRGLRELGLECFEPKGAFYIFPSIKNTGLPSEEFTERLLLEEGVVVVPGNVFGECGEGYIRCSYATSQQNIKEALARIEKFLKKIRKRR